ncbi:FxSxx-COOH system tetratricopeptide repeat protein [Actinomadura sp. DC4]|nr:FxSxx-COOH system tetratricopeptide repeat protein [Actinomadura sp. DC4]MDN3353813.1 FxSxx-COOH system tetratricopeptide repeat protein [Actinomadura sp. DC4]
MNSRERGTVPEVWGRKVPGRNKNFTGRDDLLDQLHARIQNRTTAVLPHPGGVEEEEVERAPILSHALQGMGGVGKTQLVTEYAYRYKSEYQLVWWVPADQPMLIRPSLAGLAPYLDLPPATATGIGEAADAVLESLRKGDPYDRWLLIFDNVDEPDELKGLLPQGPGHVLITSRNHRWQGVVDTLQVDVFERNESVEFLNRRVPSAMSHGDAHVLAAALGDLPLALEQAGALQAETGMQVDEYLDLLKKRTAELMSESKPSEYPHSMTAAWSLSVSALGDKLPEAVELLRCCAFFGAEPIPRDLFRRVGEATRPLLGEVLADAILLSRAIRELGRFALARVDVSSRTIQVHRLVQALLREGLEEADHQLFRREVQTLLAKNAPKDPDNESRWSRFNELMAHVLPARVAESSDPEVRDFALNMVRYLYLAGNREYARTFAEEFLDQWQRVPGADGDLRVLRAQRFLADVLRDLGDYQRAAEIDLSLLERARHAFGNDDPNVLTFLGGLGPDLRALGRFVDAQDHDEIARDQHVAMLGEDDPRTLRMVNNLALDYGLLSQYKESRRLHLLAFNQQSQASVGVVSKSDVLSSWNNVARVVRQSGEYATARDLGEEALEFGRQELGVEHHLTLRVGKDLAVALRRTADYDGALELATDVFERCSRLFGRDNPDTLSAAMGLSNVYRVMARFEDALELAQDTMKRYPHVYSDEHPFYLCCVGNLALLHRVSGEVERAHELNTTSLAGLDARLTRDHHYALTVATNLASDLAAMGEFGQARELGEDSLVRARAVLGDEHPLTLGCAANLVVDLRADGKAAQAAELAEKTYPAYDEVLGEDHPDTRVAREGRHLDFDFDPPPI